MHSQRTLGFVALALGVTILLWGVYASQKPAEQFHEQIFGRFSQGTMRYLLAGLAICLVGGALCYDKKSR